jgi:hypothetical protein
MKLCFNRGKSLLGFSEQDFIEFGAYDIIHPDDLKYYSNAHKECNLIFFLLLFI